MQTLILKAIKMPSILQYLQHKKIGSFFAAKNYRIPNGFMIWFTCLNKKIEAVLRGVIPNTFIKWANYGSHAELASAC